jgi:hypothetical protein
VPLDEGKGGIMRQVHYTKAAATGKVAVAPVIEGGRKTRVGRLGQKA